MTYGSDYDTGPTCLAAPSTPSLLIAALAAHSFSTFEFSTLQYLLSYQLFERVHHCEYEDVEESNPSSYKYRGAQIKSKICQCVAEISATFATLTADIRPQIMLLLHPCLMMLMALHSLSLGPPYPRTSWSGMDEYCSIRRRPFLSFLSSSLQSMPGLPSSGALSILSTILPYPIRSQQGQAILAHRLPVTVTLHQQWFICQNPQGEQIYPYLLLELFVNCIQCILNGHTFQVPCGHFKP